MTIKNKVHWSKQDNKATKWKKRSERRKHCALAVVKRSQKFSPHRRPPSLGERDGQNLISWRWPLPLPTNRVWWGSMHAISSYRGNRPTHTQTPTHHPPTDRQDRLQYTAPQLARCVKNNHQHVPQERITTVLLLVLLQWSGNYYLPTGSDR